MKANIKLARIFGVELGLHYSWFIIAALIAFSLAARFHQVNPEWGNGLIWGAAIVTAILFFVCLFAHELSHAAVAKMRGLPIHRITLFLLGGMAQIEKEAADPSTEFWMGIAGPIASAVIGFVLLAIAYGIGWNPHFPPFTPGVAILVWLGYINVALAAFNMIPGFPLDGGRVLRAIIWWITKKADTATNIAVTIGQIVGVLFVLYGIFEFFERRGFDGLWIAFIGWFLMQAAGASRAQMRTEHLLHGLRVRDLMTRDCLSIDGSEPLQQFVDEHLLRTGQRCYVVMEHGKVAGLITPHEVRKIDRLDWPQTSVHAAMRSLDEIHSVPPDDPVLTAIEMMANEDVNQLPVMSDGHLEGIVSRAHIMQVLQSRAALTPE